MLVLAPTRKGFRIGTEEQEINLTRGQSDEEGRAGVPSPISHFLKA